jgi:two-component system, cell cycle sensor histidine kinase and response regulator CckA
MASPKPQTAPRGIETVLLVEPDPETRALAAFMLGKQGYHVLEAHNAMEALKIYDEHDGAVDLLFAEALMSRVNGHDLAEMLQRKSPALRVLFLADSEYVRLAGRVAAQKGLSFVPRPFTMGILAAKVREVLDAPGAGLRFLAAGGMVL